MRSLKNNYGVIAIVAVAYVGAVGVMSLDLLTEPHPWGRGYWLFPVFLLCALVVESPNLKHIYAFASVAMFILGGLINSFPIDSVESCLLLLPFCYMVLFPGTLWPIAVGAAVINGYLYQIDLQEFEAFIDVSLHTTAITVFATLMTYYYVTVRQQASDFKRESQTDFLTKLPNMNAYKEEIERVNARNADQFALIHIGLVGFKNVNDRLGYRHGDDLLIAFSNHTKQVIGEDGTLFRLGGDELLVLVESEELIATLDNLVAEFNKQQHMMYDIDNTSHRLNFCLGIAFAADARESHEVWEKNADFALYKARRDKKTNVCWFDDELLGETIRQHQIETEIKSALEHKQLILMFQPKVSLETNQVMGAEALVRWNHPQLGMVPPSEFIPLAEKTTQIVPVGHWVIFEACRKAKEYSDAGTPMCIAVNVSTVQFAHADLFDVVVRALKETELPSHLLQMEITESSLMSDPESIMDICRQLRALGVTIAIDDFGVEYSSLKYLKQLPIDIIKIDKCFVDDCVSSESGRILIRTMIQMGHSLGIKLVAEGVEHQEQLDVLAAEECDQYQGYLFSQPLDSEAFSSMLKQQLTT